MGVYKTSRFFGGSEVAGYKAFTKDIFTELAGYKTSFFLTPPKCGVKNSAPVKGLFPDLALYKTSL